MSAEWKDRTFADIGFHVRMRPSCYGLPHSGDTSTDRAINVDYEVREVSVGYDIADVAQESPINIYTKSTAPSEETTSVDDAEMFARGTIKWDGCSHNHLPAYHHACSRDEMVAIGTLYNRLFDMAIEMMPGNEGYLQ